MEAIAILSFFSLVIIFFIRGKGDFGLKPTSKEIDPFQSDFPKKDSKYQ